MTTIRAKCPECGEEELYATVMEEYGGIPLIVNPEQEVFDYDTWDGNSGGSYITRVECYSCMAEWDEGDELFDLYLEVVEGKELVK